MGYTPKSQRGKKKLDEREELINKIEGAIGSLKSVPWSEVSTEDLQKLWSGIRYYAKSSPP